MSSARPESGFTLLEMLGANVLLAIALGILLAGMSQSVRMLAKDEVKNRMGVVARSLIAETDNTTLQAGWTHGERDNLTWRLDCTETDVNVQAGVRLISLRLTVSQGVYHEVFSTVRAQSVVRERQQ